MSKSLADLRANPPTSRPERTRTVCLVPHLVAEAQALAEEISNIDLPAQPDDDGDHNEGEPRKAAKSDEEVRYAEAKARLAEVLAEIAENEGEFRTRAKWSDGEWRQWVDKHPPRAKDKPGHDRDVRLGIMAVNVPMAFCNADALIDTLGSFVHTWNSELLAEGDWSALFESVTGNGDKLELAADVLGMYEGRTDFPQWRSGLSANLLKLNGSASPAPSPFHRPSSTDGSVPSSTSTSTPPATPPE